MQCERAYREEVHSIMGKGKTITVRNLTPVYTEQERNTVKKEISKTLYGVFSKYR